MSIPESLLKNHGIVYELCCVDFHLLSGDDNRHLMFLVEDLNFEHENASMRVV